MRNTNRTTSTPARTSPSAAAAALCLATGLALVGCGGGGGGSAPAPAPTPPAPAPAPAAACLAKAVSFDACTYNAPALASGGSSSIATLTQGYSGSATAQCTNGDVTLVTTSQSCVKSGPTAADLALQTSVPTPTYPADSPQRIVFDYLNKQRGQCGFGLLAQNDKIDTAARLHLEYAFLRFEAGITEWTKFIVTDNSHQQIPGLSGFTGATAWDRLRNAGYMGSSFGVEETSIGTVGVNDDGTTLADDYMARGAIYLLTGNVYHMGALMGADRDIGIGWLTRRAVSPTRAFIEQTTPLLVSGLVINKGYVTHPQRTETLRSYPCQGADDVSPDMRTETPNPLAGTGLSFPTGTPILVRAPKETDALVIRSATVAPADVVVGTPAPESFSTTGNSILVLSNSRDRLVAVSDGYLVPHRPLAWDTNYRVTAEVSINGTVSTMSFIFRTAKQRAVKTVKAP